jgi:hypothetical protein
MTPILMTIMICVLGGDLHDEKDVAMTSMTISTITTMESRE